MKSKIAVVLSLVACAAIGVVTDARADGPAASAAPAQAAPAVRPLPADQSAQIVAKVQAFYDKTQTFACDFKQEFWVKAYNQKKNSNGKVVFSKPGKMDWVYADPKDNRVVSDGVTLRVYEAANKQLYEQNISKSQYPAALSFLTGNGKLTDNFNFETLEGEAMSFPGGYVLVGTPKQPTPAYQKVLFYVDKGSLQILRALVIDAQGNRNRFDFSAARVNDPVPAGQFNFTPPPGTSIVRP